MFVSHLDYEYQGATNVTDIVDEYTPSPRETRILVPEKHHVMRKPC